MKTSANSDCSTSVTVIVPARNEANDIAGAIRSIGRQDFGADRIELVVVDGASDDDTADVAKRTFDEFPFLRAQLVTNADGRTPSNLNRGVVESESPLVIRVDARSRIPSNYVRSIVELLRDPAIAVAGGRQVAVAPHDSQVGRAIARALNNSLGMGFSRYRRRGAQSGAADTVYLGAFRRADLESVGGWNEHMASNQDFELNRKLSALGAIWVQADLEVAYVPRATIAELFRQYHRFGRWKVAYWRSTGDRPQVRQLVLIATPAIGIVAGSSALAIWGLRAAVWGSSTTALVSLAVDHVGSGGESASSIERTVAAAANATVGAGWFSGVVRETLRPTLVPTIRDSSEASPRSPR